MLYERPVHYLGASLKLLTPTNETAMSTSDTMRIRIPQTSVQVIARGRGDNATAYGANAKRGVAIPIIKPSARVANEFLIYEMIASIVHVDGGELQHAFGIFESDTSVTPTTDAAGFDAQRFYPLITDNGVAGEGSIRFTVRSQDLIANTDQMYAGLAIFNPSGASITSRPVFHFSCKLLDKQETHTNPYRI